MANIYTIEEQNEAYKKSANVKIHILVQILKMIDISTARGAYQPNELTFIGSIYESITKGVEQSMALARSELKQRKVERSAERPVERSAERPVESVQRPDERPQNRSEERPIERSEDRQADQKKVDLEEYNRLLEQYTLLQQNLAKNNDNNIIEQRPQVFNRS